MSKTKVEIFGVLWNRFYYVEDLDFRLVRKTSYWGVSLLFRDREVTSRGVSKQIKDLYVSI